jgi:hypothetical protein
VSTRLFDRVATLVVGTLDLTGFRFKFHVEKSIKPEPNTVRIEVYNLSPDHRSALAEIVPGKKLAKKGKGKTSPSLHGKIPVQLEAGYRDSGPQLVFLGDLVTVDSERDGPDWITTITSGDGARNYRTARINQTFRKGTTVQAAMQSIVKVLGLGQGNLGQIRPTDANGSGVLVSGMSVSGPAARAMSDLCRSAGLEWSCQDGTLTILEQGKALAGKALVLDRASGMISSPNVDGDGILKVKTLMIPGVQIGRLVVVDATQVKGNFRIEKVTTEGDTHGSDWGHEIEAKRY